MLKKRLILCIIIVVIVIVVILSFANINCRRACAHIEGDGWRDCMVACEGAAR